MKNNKLRCTAPRSEDAELRAMQAEIERTNTRLHEVATLCATVEQERDAALARLSKIERQEPVGYLYDWVHSSATGRDDETYTGFTKDKAHAEKHDNAIAIYAAAGASPVEPSQAQPPAPSDTAITYMTGYSDGREWAAAPIPQQPSVPEGWKLVPIEPTEAMLEVGFFAENDVFDSAKTKRIHVWKDMLSAAPQPKDMK